MSEKVTALIQEINTGLTTVSSSRKDEISIMRAMLNDDSYEVGVYGKNGQEGTYCPAAEFKSLMTSVINGAAKVPMDEAKSLADAYEVKRSEAEKMVGISKEFVNTFLKTGRKISMGAREKSNISIAQKIVPETTRSYPVKVGVNEDGTDRYSKAPTKIPGHESIKVYSSCPDWVK